MIRIDRVSFKIICFQHKFFHLIQSKICPICTSETSSLNIEGILIPCRTKISRTFPRYLSNKLQLKSNRKTCRFFYQTYWILQYFFNPSFTYVLFRRYFQSTVCPMNRTSEILKLFCRSILSDWRAQFTPHTSKKLPMYVHDIFSQPLKLSSATYKCQYCVKIKIFRPVRPVVKYSG